MKREFTPGPPINEKLVEWLNFNRGKLIQLPVNLEIKRLSISRSYLTNGTTKISIKIDTGAMGLDLPEQAKPYCRKNSCRVWLEGTWGSLVQDTESSIAVFAVRRVIGKANAKDVSVRILK